jgi:hypothetical protein
VKRPEPVGLWNRRSLCDAAIRRRQRNKIGSLTLLGRRRNVKAGRGSARN